MHIPIVLYFALNKDIRRQEIKENGVPLRS
jgi:hypothetical protein